MKVFISWSGDLSHKIALILRTWLPSVIQAVEPYVSSEDIDKGTRWSTDISRELEESSYGILCVTKDNLEASWLNFEAGALSKSFEKSRVSPFLFDIRRSEVKGPLLQFQSVMNNKDDIKKLLHSINESCDQNKLDEVRLDAIFDVWWPKLEEQLGQIETNTGAQEKAEITTDTPEILEEILELARSQQKLLSDPESLFPREYVRYIAKSMRPPIPSPGALRDLFQRWMELTEMIGTYPSINAIPVDKLHERVMKMQKPINYLKRNYYIDREMRFSLPGKRIRKEMIDD